MRTKLGSAYRHARRVIVAVVGGTVVLAGVALLVLPGPAVLVIPVGLGILGLEFAWARRWLRRARDQAKSLIGGRQSRDPSSEPPLSQ